MSVCVRLFKARGLLGNSFVFCSTPRAATQAPQKEGNTRAGAKVAALTDWCEATQPPSRDFSPWHPTTCSGRGGRGRKPRGGAPGRLFAEVAGAAGCGATSSASPSWRGCPGAREAQRPRAALPPGRRRCGTVRPESAPGPRRQREERASRAARRLVPSTFPRAPGGQPREAGSSASCPVLSSSLRQSRERASIAILRRTGIFLLTFQGSPSRGQRGKRESQIGAESRERGHPLLSREKSP